MNIYTVRDNLKNTIAGKEKMLEALHPNNPFTTEYMEEGEAMAHRATIEFLKVNIRELKRILEDVEQCCKKATDQSCVTNPDRMGGASTADEINESRAWR